MALGGVLGPALVARDAAALCGRFAWQAWHLVTSTLVSRGRRCTISHLRSFCVAGVVLCGRRGTHGTGWRAWARFGRV